MTQTIAGVAIPDSMAYRAKSYDMPEPPILGTNGQKRPVERGAATSLTWIFSTLTIAEFQWWRLTTIGPLNRSIVADVRLFNPKHGAEANFSDAVVYAPVAEAYHNGRYFNVTVYIDNLIDETWFFDTGYFFDDGMYFS